jgi:type II secretory pathway predicted ATPase ExeA
VLESEKRCNARCVYLNNPTLTRDEFIHFLALAFDLSSAAASSKTVLLRELEQELRERRAQGGAVTALLVDEAQALPLELLEEIRLLANIETESEKLLPVVLAGQPQLADKLNHPDLRQLKQRVALRCSLQPLNLAETCAYISRRIHIAGGTTELFTHDAVEAIYRYARGIPRTISVICDNALVNGFAADQRPVGKDLVLEVCRDFDLYPAEPEVPRPLVRDVDAAPRVATAPVAQSPKLPEKAGGSSGGDSMFSVFTRRRRFSFF